MERGGSNATCNTASKLFSILTNCQVVWVSLHHENRENSYN